MINTCNKKQFLKHALVVLSISVGYVTNVMSQDYQQEEGRYLESRALSNLKVHREPSSVSIQSSSSSSTAGGSNLSSHCNNGLCTICVNGNCINETGNSISTSQTCTNAGCQIKTCVDNKCHVFNA